MRMDMDSIDASAWAWVPPRKTVDWRGNRVTEKEGIALKHLFDDMQNYFGQPDGEPNVTLTISRLHQEDDDETYGDRITNNNNNANAASTMWRGNLDFTYMMNHRKRNTSQKLHYMAMDVCLDLNPKKELNFGGHDMSDYCRTWMYAYAPRYTVETFLRYFEAGTGLKASSNGLILDEERKIVHFEPKLLTEAQSEPGFWIADEDDDDQFTRIGTIHEASQDPSNQFLFRCIGIFAVTAEVVSIPSRTHGDNANANANNAEEEARLTFTLVNVRTLGIVNNIAPVVYNPRHCTICNVSTNPEWWE
ncbi:hypothetical protein QTG54_006529 [Skeletonema marinoi]|uniref:Uncharacterized protein n=1 Tax=Skeletonema marinoi TaxID=267567 RepID=A0AAD9DD49_9STRA|nr:hypothetical protein QTG54_006529 [Skeletonema marinoi]